jgi:manganese-dependent inorganic pyrophosphatase
MSMAAPIYVLGHRNPDTDSICSAIGYAALLREQGEARAMAARAGDLRPETEYVLQRFGVETPLLVTDVRPRVADVMTSPAVTVHLDTLILEVGRLLQTQNVRAIPVVDDEGKLCGVTGVEDFARGFITGLDQHELGKLPLDLAHVRHALDTLSRCRVFCPARRTSYRFWGRSHARSPMDKAFLER